jgi:hypothetical protein
MLKKIMNQHTKSVLLLPKKFFLRYEYTRNFSDLKGPVAIKQAKQALNASIETDLQTGKDE